MAATVFGHNHFSPALMLVNSSNLQYLQTYCEFICKDMQKAVLTEDGAGDKVGYK